jgi:hypothetical protein
MTRRPIDVRLLLAKPKTVLGRMLFGSVVRHTLGVLVVTLHK